MPFFKKITQNLVFAAISSILLISCSGNSIFESTIPDDTGKTEKQKSVERKLEDLDINLPADSPVLKGEGVLTLENIFGFDPGANYAVNSILFKVALDKIDFMPLASVDVGSGVIVTDWYSFDDGKTRIKINMRIIDEEMNDGSLIVNLFKQSFENNVWVDQGMDKEQALKIQSSILATARDLKIASEL
tara:strand:+ start:215 stop:781 length:567 start_codon:yes stop_codon:yes gene_type:complete